MKPIYGMLCLLVVSIAVGAVPVTNCLRAAEAEGVDEVADLKTRLEKDLMARTPGEFAFVATVLAKVDDGTLPLKMVNGTYLWARPKRPYPFVYFQRALRIRASKIGVEL